MSDPEQPEPRNPANVKQTLDRVCSNTCNKSSKSGQLSMGPASFLVHRKVYAILDLIPMLEYAQAAHALIPELAELIEQGYIAPKSTLYGDIERIISLCQEWIDASIAFDSYAPGQ